MTLSPTAYARHRKARGLPGGTHVAVLKALRAGRIEAEPDGTIDPAKADAAWNANTDAGRRRSRPTEVGDEAPAPVRLAPSRGASGDGNTPLVGGPSYARSRAIREAHAARLAKLDDEEQSGAQARTRPEAPPDPRRRLAAPTLSRRPSQRSSRRCARTPSPR